MLRVRRAFTLAGASALRTAFLKPKRYFAFTGLALRENGSKGVKKRVKIGGLISTESIDVWYTVENEERILSSRK